MTLDSDAAQLDISFIGVGEDLKGHRLLVAGTVKKLDPVPWSQRLGYILDLVEYPTRSERLASFVEARATETALLIPGTKRSSARRDAR